MASRPLRSQFEGLHGRRRGPWDRRDPGPRSGKEFKLISLLPSVLFAFHILRAFACHSWLGQFCATAAAQTQSASSIFHLFLDQRLNRPKSFPPSHFPSISPILSLPSVLLTENRAQCMTKRKARSPTDTTAIDAGRNKSIRLQQQQQQLVLLLLTLKVLATVSVHSPTRPPARPLVRPSDRQTKA